MSKRPVHEIEAKWQAEWEKTKLYQAADPGKDTAEKFYGLVEFPFPSGEGLHVGHPRSYIAVDAMTRKQRMSGKNVLYSIGWDAFGLPAENYAIKHKVKPQDATQKNINNFRRQLKSIGFGFDWDREIDTTDPKYFKWTQWQFLQFFKHGLAYKAKTNINWCPKDKIGLANEEVVGGCCERCGTPVEKREKEQWMIAITQYAERLIADLDTVDYLPQIKSQQINWIGKSEGAYIDFSVGHETVRVFTTRPDTLFGATYLVLAPEHPLAAGHEEAKAYIEAARKKTEIERTNEDKEKTGVRLEGVMAINPANGQEIPVWISDYVLAHYGTGAIMAVPAHDERDEAFAKKFDLPIVQVISEEQIMINSGFMDGVPAWKAKDEMISWLEEKKCGEGTTTYKLRDWVFSRQRYWGEPIPIINCKKCGHVPVPDDQLPLTLPDVEVYEPTDSGESPLASMRAWVEVKCPTCGGDAERETDTMPNWAGSSWYFLRYCDPHNDQALASSEKLKYWMPVDLYNGGMEHTTLHLLYSRFWYKFLWDIGAVPQECGSEPYKVRRSHGLIMAQGGEKMSKSKGNVVNPDDVVNEYGADVFRLYQMFMGPFDQAVPWDTNGIEGVRKYLDRVWNMFELAPVAATEELETLYHQTVKKVTEGIDHMHFNTCVSQLMILLNAFSDAGGIPEAMQKGFIQLLAPFVPHLAAELWQKIGATGSVHLSGWPSFDSSKLQASSFTLVVQVNGKIRGKAVVDSNVSEDEAKAKALELVEKWLEGKTPKQVIYVKGKLVSVVV